MRLAYERDSLRGISNQIGGSTPVTAIADAHCAARPPSLMGTQAEPGIPDVGWASSTAQSVHGKNWDNGMLGW